VSNRNFLDVDRSVSGRRWVPRLTDSRLAEAISQRHELPEILGRVMAARGVGLDEAEGFLNPTLRNLMPQPSALKDMEKGAACLADAIRAGSRIGIITDYDVDGVCSGAIFKLFLKAVGSDAIIHVPDRMTEGYGPSEFAVKSLKEQGCDLLLTLDCGVLAHDPLAHAAELGLTAIIVDHHQASEILPQAHAVINPNRQDDTSGFGYLCAAGVVMILVATINKLLRARGWYTPERPEPNMLQWLELVALATVCDVVPLKGLNRAYVTQGLKIMSRRENLGLAQLTDIARLKRSPDVYALGFVLGPRLNAAGRIGHGDLALELLTTRDKGRANQIAQELELLNRERQAIELRVVDAAIVQAEAARGKEHRASVLVVAGDGWHPGVVGLAASRLKDRYECPSFVLANNAKTGLSSGSGRSIAGVDLGAAVRDALEAGIIIKGGGHAMAAGLTVEISKLGQFREFIEGKLSGQVSAAAENTLSIDGALTASGATLDLIELLEQAGPYGSAHPSPMFAFPAHKVVYADPAGADHIRCTLAAPDGTKIKAIAFRAMGTELGEVLLTERKLPLHIAGRLTIDEWGAKRVSSVQIEDIARVL
jgi:single-stranded-DNA-specific exonuclease